MAQFVDSEATGASYAVDLSSFTEQEHNRFIEIYQTIDTDGDGSISVRELKKMFDDLGYTISKKVLRRLIRIVDTDHNGTLSYPEFVSLIALVNDTLANDAQGAEIYEANFSQFSPEKIHHFETIFQIVDENQDGTVSVPELYEMFFVLGYNISPDAVREMVRVVDSDRSGNLSFEEFVSLLVLVEAAEDEAAAADAAGNNGTFQVDPSQFPPEEIERLYSLFRSVDKNHDGTVCINELNGMFVSLQYDVSAEILDEMIRTVDSDGSGDLSFREFLSLVYLITHDQSNETSAAEAAGGHVTISDEDLIRFREIFDSYDTDGSNSISTHELGALFTMLGYQTTEEMMRRFIAMVDTNNDGELNFQEFVQLILAYLESEQQTS